MKFASATKLHRKSGGAPVYRAQETKSARFLHRSNLVKSGFQPSLRDWFAPGPEFANGFAADSLALISLGAVRACPSPPGSWKG